MFTKSIIAALVAVALLTGALTFERTGEEARIMQQARESAARQDAQAERELARQLAEADKLEGRIILTTYGERAQEAGIAPEAFDNARGAQIVLLALDVPQEVTARAYEDGSPEQTRTASLVRLPDQVAQYVTDGEAVRVSVLSWEFWPSDITGALWDVQAQCVSLDK